jgi:hypothetical protein
MKIKRVKSNKSYTPFSDYSFVPAEKSPLFKILYTSLITEQKKISSFNFELGKKGCFTSSNLNYCRIKLEAYCYKDYEGVQLKIYDDYLKEIVTSRNLKVDFIGTRNDISENYIRNIREIRKAFPEPYFFEHIFINGHSCEFKIKNLSIPEGYRKDLGFDLHARNDGYGRICEFILGLGFNTHKFYKPSDLYKGNFKEIFEMEFLNFWRENIDLAKTPYFSNA